MTNDAAIKRTVEVPFPCGVRLRVLEHRSRMHNFRRWESDYLEELHATLRPGMVVYDVGAEEGEFSAFAASVVGGRNVHLFEPTPTVWPNIRTVWEANGLDGPGGCWAGFLADPDSVRAPTSGIGWPPFSVGPLQPDGRFSVVHERPDIQSTTVDLYAERTGVPPAVIMMDVEGAETLVVRGMERTLATARPIVFVSVHPEDFIGRLGGTSDELHRRFLGHNYRASLIATDHESHWVFHPNA